MDRVFQLNRFLPFRVASLADELSRSLAKHYREPFDISVSEWRILAVLSEAGRANAGELGTMTQMEKPRVSRALNKMQTRGLLSRQPDQNDQRVSVIQLTEQGNALYQKIAPLADSWEQKLLATLSDQEVRCIHEVLDKMKARVSELGSDADTG